MADAMDSKSISRKGVGVQVPPPAPLFSEGLRESSPKCYKNLVGKINSAEEPFGQPFKDLVDRCFSMNLHRLRGVRGLLSGWIEIGVPESEQSRLRQRMDEDLLLLGRLDWLRSMLHHAPPRQRILLGEAPAVLLACALGLGTPEEARERLPIIHQAEAAVALALWLQMQTKDFDSASIRCGWQGECFEVVLTETKNAELDCWQRIYSQWIAEMEPKRLMMRPHCFSMHPQTSALHQS
jgi:hypothetical protein